MEIVFTKLEPGEAHHLHGEGNESDCKRSDQNDLQKKLPKTGPHVKVLILTRTISLLLRILFLISNFEEVYYNEYETLQHACYQVVIMFLSTEELSLYELQKLFILILSVGL